MASVFELEKKVKPNGKFNQAIFNTLSPADQNRLKALDSSRKTGQTTNYEGGTSPSYWSNTGGGSPMGSIADFATSGITSSYVQPSGGGSMGGDTWWNDVKNEGRLNGTLYRDKNEWLKAGGQSFQSEKVPTAEDIIGAQLGKIKEQVSFLKDFMTNNPFAFDESLARDMATDKYKPYYTEILQDFVNPLQTKISRSTEDESRLVDEIVRKKGVGTREYTRSMMDAIDKAREGFAGSGLLGSGIASRDEAKIGIEGRDKISSFEAASDFNKTQTGIEQARVREDATTAIGQKERDVFGTGRAFDTSVSQDVLGQETQAKQTYGARLLDAVSSRFGSPLVNIPEYLQLA